MLVDQITASQREELALFLATYPTPNVRRAFALADAGAITWSQLYKLSQDALAVALAEVAR